MSEKWPWNGEFVRLLLIVPSAVGITATVALFPFAGAHSLWFLTAIPIGLGMSLVYRSVGRRVEDLKRQPQEDGGEIAEGLLVIGAIHSPGIVVLRRDEIELIPIVGERRTIDLRRVDTIGEGQWLPGKWVWGKRAFTINAAVCRPLAFAVAKSVAGRWSPLLHRHSRATGGRDS